MEVKKQNIFLQIQRIILQKVDLFLKYTLIIFGIIDDMYKNFTLESYKGITITNH